MENMVMAASPLEAAISYAARGWSVFPVHSLHTGRCTCGQSDCDSAGKHPRVSRGFHQATTDAQQIRRWWSNWPTANVGIRTGSDSGIVVIDVDPGAGGNESLTTLTDEFGPLPRTVEAHSGGGGRHFYFRYPEFPMRNKTGLRPGIDVRGEGGYIIAPPSMHISGGTYQWQPGCAPDEVALAELPVTLYTFPNLISLTDDAVLRAATRYAESVPPAARGSRNSAAFKLTGHLLAFVSEQGKRLEFSTVQELVRAWNRRSPEPLSENELDQTIESASRNGTPRKDHPVVEKSPQESQRNSVAAQLVALADDVELFCCDDCAYASFEVGAHRETWGLKQRAFRTWLGHRFHQATGRVAGEQALLDAIGVLTGRALYESRREPVAVRTAAHQSEIWVDLCDDEWRAVRVDAAGWQIVKSHEVPVRFVRRRAMQALPIPEPGGTLNRLRPFLNVREDMDWVLLLGWLVTALRPIGPYPVLLILGEYGSAKSSLTRILRKLIDPNHAPIRAAPRDIRDLAIAANNGHLLAFDNLSGIPVSLSDAFCRLATGGGFSTRQLHTDGDEMIFNAVKPIVLNGIESPATQPDLLDRALTITLEPLAQHQRRTERQLSAELDPLLPRIFGALLSAMGAALAHLDHVQLETLPRMADFAEWAVAAEPSLGLRTGAFLAAYSANRQDAEQQVVQDSVVGHGIQQLLQGRERWGGTQTELLAALNELVPPQRRPADWPGGPRKIRGELNRLSPALRSVGIKVSIPKHRTGRAKELIITLEKQGVQHSAQSARAAIGPDDALAEVGPRSVAEHVPPPNAPQRSASDPRHTPELPIADRAECAERCIPNVSDGLDDADGSSEPVPVDVLATYPEAGDGEEVFEL